MKIADYGNKEIHSRIAQNSAMYELYLTGSGPVPNALGGLYSSTREAELAVQAWQGKNASRQAKNAASTKATKAIKNAKAS